MRPHELALTFMNYEFPQYWYRTPEAADPNIVAYIDSISRIASVPVRYLSWGPESSHISEVPFLHAPASGSGAI